MIRKIKRVVRGEAGVDGAGVHLTHVLSRHTMHDTDPLLLLDAFDATDPADYVAGFPMHPTGASRPSPTWWKAPWCTGILWAMKTPSQTAASSG